MREYAALPHEYWEEMADLTDEEWGRLTRALLRYSMTGEETALSGNERFFWRRVVNRERRYQERFQDVSVKRSEAGKKGAQQRWKGKGMANDSKYGNPESKAESESNPYDKTLPRSTERRNRAAPAAQTERMKQDMARMEQAMKGGGDV